MEEAIGLGESAWVDCEMGVPGVGDDNVVEGGVLLAEAREAYS